MLKKATEQLETFYLFVKSLSIAVGWFPFPQDHFLFPKKFCSWLTDLDLTPDQRLMLVWQQHTLVCNILLHLSRPYLSNLKLSYQLNSKD